MTTILVLVVLAYVLRRVLGWICVRMIAFAVGFVIGWRFMEQR